MEIRPATIDDQIVIAEFNIAMAPETEDLRFKSRNVAK